MVCDFRFITTPYLISAVGKTQKQSPSCHSVSSTLSLKSRVYLHISSLVVMTRNRTVTMRIKRLAGPFTFCCSITETSPGTRCANSSSSTGDKQKDPWWGQKDAEETGCRKKSDCLTTIFYLSCLISIRSTMADRRI
jgi:hypothetical protein